MRFQNTMLVGMMVLDSLGCSGEEVSVPDKVVAQVTVQTPKQSNSSSPSPSTPSPSASIAPETSSKPEAVIDNRPHDGQVRYYDTTDITTPALPTDSLLYYEREVQAYLNKGSKLQHWDTGRNLSVSDLDWAQLYAVHISLTMERVNEEKDLILHSDQEEYRAVSVAHEPNAIIRVSDSRAWQPKYPKVDKSELLQTYRLKALVDSGAKWKPKSINVLADTFNYLTEKEKTYFAGVGFIRQNVGSMGSQAGLYRFEESDGHIQQSITVYNNAFDGMRHSFCGSITEPRSAAHSIILHEMGHLLANQPNVFFERQFNVLIDSFNAKAEQFNQRNDAQLEAEITELRRQMEEMQANPVSAEGPIIEAFLQHRTFQEGPTEYANTSSQEAFAEAYALFKLDPQALNRVDPAVFQWFQSGAYLDMLP